MRSNCAQFPRSRILYFIYTYVRMSICSVLKLCAALSCHAPPDLLQPSVVLLITGNGVHVPRLVQPLE